jgi:signal transduction histidine kinase
MKPLARTILLAILLVVFFLFLAFVAQLKIQHETRRLHEEAQKSLERRLSALVAAHPKALETWGAEELRKSGTILQARLSILDRDKALVTPESRVFADLSYGPQGKFTLRAESELPSGGQLLLLFERILVTLLISGLILITTLSIAVLILRARNAETIPLVTETPVRPLHLEGMAQLAKTSVDREEALRREKGVRERTEQDLAFNRELLSRALDEKIQLGRDLHDGLIQSLYSAGLVLQSADTRLEKDPAVAHERIQQAITVINTSIREVRSHIQGLSPEALRRSGFKQALASTADELRANLDVSIDHRIDEEAVSMLNPNQSRELLQIAREAISNALRHGKAKNIRLNLLRCDEEILFHVSDDGCGFPAGERRPGGHGLGNMDARAQAVGGRLTIKSQLGLGCEISLILPVAPKT